MNAKLYLAKTHKDNMLVETYNIKEPKQHLENSKEVLQKIPSNNGHVSHNI
jgi:ferritin